MSIQIQDCEFLYVPVPKALVPAVYAWIGEQGSLQPPSPDQRATPRDAESTTGREPSAELIRRMYDESEPAHRELMQFLAEHPNEWLYSRELADGLRLEHGTKSLAGMLGAFGRRASHRYGGQKPWRSVWDGAREEARHRMSADVAVAVRSAVETAE